MRYNKIATVKAGADLFLNYAMKHDEKVTIDENQWIIKFRHVGGTNRTLL